MVGYGVLVKGWQYATAFSIHPVHPLTRIALWGVGGGIFNIHAPTWVVDITILATASGILIDER
jgi:hypothetical protein